MLQRASSLGRLFGTTYKCKMGMRFGTDCMSIKFMWIKWNLKA